MTQELTELFEFLGCRTPQAWLGNAVQNIDVLLIDHAHCERKAAASAINLITLAPENTELVALMSPLAREEMLHFEKVLQILKQRNIPFTNLPPSNYAQSLHRISYKKNKERRLLDLLLIGAIIEARSCERFASLLNVLEDDELNSFYRNLVKAEARHFREYLRLAALVEPHYNERLQFFLQAEEKYINSVDNVYRFHSGLPHSELF